jgi:hypothetical protein
MLDRQCVYMFTSTLDVAEESLGEIEFLVSSRIKVFEDLREIWLVYCVWGISLFDWVWP